MKMRTNMLKVERITQMQQLRGSSMIQHPASPPLQRCAEPSEVSLGPKFAKKTNKQEHKISLKFPIQENLQSRPVYKSKIPFSKEPKSKMKMISITLKVVGK